MASVVVSFSISMVDKVTFSLFQHQSNLKYHGHCYPFQTKKMKHVLDISVCVASTHLAPILGRGHQSKKLHTPPPRALGLLDDAVESYCTVLLYYSSLKRGWLGLASAMKRTSLISVSQRSRMECLNWNRPLAWRAPSPATQRYMVGATNLSSQRC